VARRIKWGEKSEDQSHSRTIFNHALKSTIEGDRHRRCMGVGPEQRNERLGTVTKDIKGVSFREIGSEGKGAICHSLSSDWTRFNDRIIV